MDFLPPTQRSPLTSSSFKNEPYPPVLSALDSISPEDDNRGCQSDGIGWSDPESESESGSDYSPFPFSPSAGNNNRDEDEDRNEHDRECDQLLTLGEGHAHAHADMNEKPTLHRQVRYQREIPTPAPARRPIRGGANGATPGNRIAHITVGIAVVAFSKVSNPLFPSVFVCFAPFVK